MRYNADETQTKKAARCPYCGSNETEPLSLFGQQLLTVQMYCNTCHTPFEYVKDENILKEFTPRKEDQA